MNACVWTIRVEENEPRLTVKLFLEDVLQMSLLDTVYVS